MQWRIPFGIACTEWPRHLSARHGPDESNEHTRYGFSGFFFFKSCSIDRRSTPFFTLYLQSFIDLLEILHLKFRPSTKMNATQKHGIKLHINKRTNKLDGRNSGTDWLRCSPISCSACSCCSHVCCSCCFSCFISCSSCSINSQETSPITSQYCTGFLKRNTLPNFNRLCIVTLS